MSTTRVDHSLFLVDGNTTEDQRDLYQKSCRWLDRYLRTLLQEENACLLIALRPLLANGTKMDIMILQRFLHSVAETVRSSGHISLATMVQELQQKNVLVADEVNSVSCCQAVFVVFGWITQLYKPLLPPRQGSISIQTPDTQPIPRRFLNRPVYPSSVVVDEDLMSFSFKQLLASFGQRLPEDRFVPAALVQPDPIIASNIYFSNLSFVGKMCIQWIDSLLEHLLIDERTRTLKLFKYPAYCALICLSSPESTDFMNKLLIETKDDESSRSFNAEYVNAPQPFDNFCREILVSFGMIFGQDKRSRRTALGCLREIWPQEVAADCVLQSICGAGARRWKDHALFNYLNSPPVRSNYTAEVDFPFLGRRLLRLQEYMNAQSPNDFHTLVFDRRDHLRYWTFISVLAFGIISIVLGILQVLLATGQIIQGLSN